MFARFLLCCLKCCFWCLERFIRFMNRNAYIMVKVCLIIVIIVLCYETLPVSYISSRLQSMEIVSALQLGKLSIC